MENTMSLFWFADIIVPLSILALAYGGMRFYEWADKRDRAKNPPTKTDDWS